VVHESGGHRVLQDAVKRWVCEKEPERRLFSYAGHPSVVCTAKSVSMAAATLSKWNFCFCHNLAATAGGKPLAECAKNSPWHSSAVYLLSSVQKKNLPLNNCTAMTAKMNCQERESVKVNADHVSLAYLKKDVNDEDVEDVLERVDHAVKDCLQLRHALDRLEWPQDAQDAQGFDCAQVLACRTPSVMQVTW